MIVTPRTMDICMRRRVIRAASLFVSGRFLVKMQTVG
jgi:hypothetical protein